MLIPRNVQLQIINHLLRDRLPPDTTAGQLDQFSCHFAAPWGQHLDRLLDIIDLANPQERQRHLDTYAYNWLDETEREQLRQADQNRPTFLSLAQLSEQLPPIRWLWPGWIPRGMLSLLGAVPGAGKSYLALDLARRVIQAEPWPDGAAGLRDGGDVIYVDAEAVPQLIDQRARHWKMDRHRLYPMVPQDYTIIDLGMFDYRDALIEMAWTIRPQLIVVDSLSSISSKGENSIEDVRHILAFLSCVAADFDCGLLLIHHLRKRSQQAPPMDVLSADDFRGSSHIITVARSVLGLSVVRTGPEPDRNGPRQLEVIKTNLARYPSPLGVAFQPLGADGVRLSYGPPPQRYTAPSTLERTMDWLLLTLRESGEPLPPREIIALARDAGYSESTVRRARKELCYEILDTHEHHNPQNRWTLTEFSAERHKDAETIE